VSHLSIALDIDDKRFSGTIATIPLVNSNHFSFVSVRLQSSGMGSYEPTPACLYDQSVHTIRISEETRLSGKPTLDIIAEGAAFLHRDGIVVLENAIDTVHIDILNAKLSKEALEVAQKPDWHFNFGKETLNMDQAPPPTKDLMFKDVWCNPFAAAILSATLGPKPVIHYANGNTALGPATGRQPVHSDCEFAHPISFPFAHVINIPLVNVSVENGSTEIWPGSHVVSMPDSHVDAPGEHMLGIQKDFLAQRADHSPPIQPNIKKGSLVIRDLRLWHAGMPNKTSTPRVMLAFVAQPAWYQAKSKIQLPLDVKPMVEEWQRDEGLCFDAEWIDGEVDHKTLSSAGVDFDTHSNALLKYRKELSEVPGWMPRFY
jgi:ectoine hydroxylase-related dioxygenase (phytanoyl-CoA dioxygenase family)